MAAPVRDGLPTRGHKKKARTRHQLLAAAVRVIATNGEAFTIAQITAEAGTAHGTFYNHFDDRDALLDAVIPEALGGFAATSAEAIDERDPALRFATITALALRRAAAAPHEARAILRLDAVHRSIGRSPAFDQLRADIAIGAASGRFAVEADGPTIDVVVGAILFAARRMIDSDVAADYPEAVVTQLLRSLGVEGDEPRALARRAVVGAQEAIRIDEQRRTPAHPER